MNKKKTCSICLEEKEEKNISSCLNCLESGNTCHNCQDQWSQHNNDPLKCIICKNNTMQNISIKSIEINKRNLTPVTVYINESNNNTSYFDNYFNCCSIYCIDKVQIQLFIIAVFLVIILILMICYGIYWLIQNY